MQIHIDFAVRVRISLYSKLYTSISRDTYHICILFQIHSDLIDDKTRPYELYTKMDVFIHLQLRNIEMRLDNNILNCTHCCI